MVKFSGILYVPRRSCAGGNSGPSSKFMGRRGGRLGLFRPTIDHAVGNKKPNSSSRKEWGFSEMATVRLNSHVRRFGGFAKGGSARTPKMPIVAIGSPHLVYFTNPKESPTTKTHQLCDVIRKLRQSSLNADFDNKLNANSRRRFRDAKSAEPFLRQSVYCTGK